MLFLNISFQELGSIFKLLNPSVFRIDLSFKVGTIFACRPDLLFEKDNPVIPPSNSFLFKF